MTMEQELEALRAKSTSTETTATLSDVNEMASNLAMLKETKKEIEDKLSETSQQIEQINKRLIDLLMANNLKSYKAPAGLVSISQLFSAPLPKGPDKILLFDYLKSQGRFEELASIHSKTFESFVKEAYELAKESGQEEPKIPGVTEVKTILRISFRSAKGKSDSNE